MIGVDRVDRVDGAGLRCRVHPRPVLLTETRTLSLSRSPSAVDGVRNRTYLSVPDRIRRVRREIDENFVQLRGVCVGGDALADARCCTTDEGHDALGYREG